ncbi:MAG: metal ABC transporter permease [Methanomassiliicoccales archaeon]|nr:MAG: metal ABC transporter permease [Methanomassiliicoccales archaeon]
MNGLELIQDMFSYTFVQNGLIGGVAAAVTCAALGVFIVLKRASLIGEGVAHLSFGGIAIGLFAGLYPLYTALALSIVGTLAISYLHKKRIVYSETAIGILFSFGLAVGAVLAKMAGGFSVDLFQYLFGDILTISHQDMLLMVVLTFVVMSFVAALYKELMLLTFDEQGSRLSGVPVGALDLVFNIMVALAVVVSIKIVGSLLVSSLIILPAATALQLSRSFRSTMVMALGLSVVSVVSGLFMSFFYDIATGGAIVLTSTAFFVASMAIKKVATKEKPITTVPCGK